MPIHDGADFVATAIESLQRQTLRHWELVAVLDRCTDDTDQILRAFGDRRVRVLSAPAPGGFARALNFGLLHCCAELVARLDHDDVSLPDRLEIQCAAFAARPSLAVLGTAANLIDNRGNVIAFRTVLTGTRSVSRGLLWRNQLIHSSVMFRTKVIQSAGAYNPDTAPILEDYDLWLRVIGLGEVDNLRDALIGYRQRSGQMSRGSTVRRESMRLLAQSRKRAGHLMGVPGPIVALMGAAWFAAQLRHEYRTVRLSSRSHA